MWRIIRSVTRFLSTKDVRQSTEGATCDGRLFGEVSEMVTRHKIYTDPGYQLDVIP